ncbi:Mce-associated membrane protein [Nocardioides massiliensis]|uniref:Mce-associated membrane protein n=3 Tax=Nocardioides massiliensis TaxID=1325935 RepID=A0ABT9NNK1_9ACTN|nr:J domain-containing protein [Nocardioides massiliensis]MDP9821991.1 Mce-associated membrane protein [Nocardioides massiliensis]
MTPPELTYYDVLGVSRDADPQQIKAAWRAAIDRYDPGEGSAQFTLFNTAAEVLLDPARRAEYDAGLTARPTPEPAPEPAPEPEPAGEPVAAGSAVRSGPPRLMVAVVVVLAVLAAGTAVWLRMQASEAAQVEDARRVAPAVAAEAAEAVLAYSHDTLAADRDAGVKYFTGNYRDDYVETMDSVIADTASQTEATVVAEVLETGVIRAEPGRAEVLLYVNQVTTSKANDGQPTTALNRVRFTMVERDGTWLVDDIESY